MKLHTPSRGADPKSLVRVLRGRRQPAAALRELVNRIVVHGSHGESSEAAEQSIIVGIRAQLDLDDPSLDTGASTCHHSPKGLRQQLSTKTDPQRWQLAIDGVLQQGGDVLQPGMVGGLMHAHRAPQDDKAILLESRWDQFTGEGTDQAEHDSVIAQPRPPALEGVVLVGLDDQDAGRSGRRR